MAAKSKQTEMPGMEDREIKELKDLALQYAEARDKRMELGLEEVALKEKLLKAMKTEKKEHYSYGGIEIRILHEEETVKVKVKRDTD